MAPERTPTPPTLTPTQPKTPRWRWLIASTVLVSLGLHGLVLFIPTGPTAEELVPPPDPEEDGVAVIKIDAPPSPRTTTPANAGTVKTAQPSATNRTRTTSTTSRSAPAQSGARSTVGRQGDRPASNANDTSLTAPLPSSDSSDQATDPNSQPPVEGGRATSDIGRRPPDRTNDDATAAEPFDEYIEIFKTYTGRQLAEADAAETQERWLQELRDRDPALANLEIRPLKIFESLPYAANICLPSSPEAAHILVFLDSDGNADQYQPFVQQTKYRAFDNAAEDRVRQHAFPESDEPRAYRVEVAVDYDETDCDWPPAVDRLPDDYFTVLESYVGPALTTPRAAGTTQAAWLQTLNESTAIDLPEGDDLEISKWEGYLPDVSYSLGICLPIAPKKQVDVGVLVQPDGTLSTDPVILRSTGYRYFDDRARTLVNTVTFDPSDAPQVLVVEVPVAYSDDDCQSLDSETFELPAASAPDRSNSEAGPSSEPSNNAAIAFDSQQQTALLTNGRQQVEASPVGSLNLQLALAAASLETGWPVDIEQSCFLADITTETFEPVETAADALILSESPTQAPVTLSRLYEAVAADAGEYCGAPLIQLTAGGAAQLLASVIPLNHEEASSLIVLWTADPRSQ